MTRILAAFVLLQTLIGAGCAHQYHQVTFRVMDAGDLRPIAGSTIGSVELKRFLDFRPEPEWVDGTTDNEGQFSARVPIDQMTVVIEAVGYDHEVLENYVDVSQPRQWVLVLMHRAIRTGDPNDWRFP